MNRAKTGKIQYFVMAIIGILLFASLLINTSLAYFTDSAQMNSETTLQFGVIDVITDIEGGKPTTVDNGVVKFVISATEVAKMEDVKRTLVLKSPETEIGTLPFFVRLSFDFYKNGVMQNQYAKMKISSSSAGYKLGASNYVSSNWTKKGDGKYYYNQAVDVKTNGEQYIPLVLHFEDIFGQETVLSTDKLYVQVSVEVIQSAHNTLEDWGGGIAYFNAGWKNALASAGIQTNDIKTIAFVNTIPLATDGWNTTPINVGASNGSTAYNDYATFTNDVVAYKKANASGGYDIAFYSSNGIKAPTNCTKLFESLTVVSVDLEHFDTANVTNMFAMFNECGSLTTLNASNLNTENVTRMDFMFCYCDSLTALDLSSFNTVNVTDMGKMFNYCVSLTTLDISNFNTSNVTNMGYVFYNCKALTTLDVSGFNTSNVTNMKNMFGDCWSLQSLDVSGFDTSKVTDMGYMFANCHSLKMLDLSNFDTLLVNDMQFMLNECRSLTILNISNFDTSNVTNMTLMFYNCKNLTSLNVSSFNTSKVTNISSVFRECNLLTTLDLSSFDLTALTSEPTYMFTGCNALTTLITPQKTHATYTVSLPKNFYKVGDITPVTTLTKGATSSYELRSATWSNYLNAGWRNALASAGIETNDIKTIAFVNTIPLATDGWNTTPINVGASNGLTAYNNSSFTFTEDVVAYKKTNASGGYDIAFYSPSGISAPTNCAHMFYDLTNVVSIDLAHFNTANVTSMYAMFSKCQNLTTLNLLNFDTSNVLWIHEMFRACSSLTTLDLSNFNTAVARNMSYMFYGCEALQSLNVSNFNTAEVTTMLSMFENCFSLTALNVSSFNTSSVTNMKSMFSCCLHLLSLDVSNFDTSNVTDMRWIFTTCQSLETLNISGFDLTALTQEPTGMIGYCNALTTLIIPQKTHATYTVSLPKNFYKVGDITPVTTLDKGATSSYELRSTTWNA